MCVREVAGLVDRDGAGAQLRRIGDGRLAVRIKDRHVPLQTPLVVKSADQTIAVVLLLIVTRHMRTR